MTSRSHQAQAPVPGQHARGNAGAPSLLVFTEHFNATYSISFELPLQWLHARGRVNYSAYSQADVKNGGARCWEAWIRACRPSAVVLTRYGRPDGVEILRYCQERALPVIYHIDDDLLDLPASLGEEVLKRHMAPAIVEARRAMLAGCDLVYASTAQLAEVLRRRFPLQQVFHGIYAPYLETRAGHADSAAPLTIGYMGSRGHQEDLELVVPALERLMRERPQLRFETFGTIAMPPALAAFGDRVRHHAVQTGYVDFLASLGRLDWHLGLAPLVDEPFNRCKAPTKFIEYTGAGIPTLASGLVVYASAMPPGGGELVGNDWYGALARWLDDTGLRLRSLEQARAHCRREYDLEKLARQVLHVTDRKVGLQQRIKGMARRAASFARRVGGKLAARAWGVVPRAGDPKRARTRILFVANSFLPTLQLCFTRPLQPLAEAGDLAWEVLADIQLKPAGRVLSGGRARWARRRIEAFRPELIVFCRYSGPQAAQITQWARERKIPTIYHLDDDLLHVPPEIGAAKHAFHNQPARLASVSHLLRETDLVYCSTRPLLERLRQQHGLDQRGLAARIHCPGVVLRAAPKGDTFKIGYMGIDHAHDFEVALPGLVRVLERNPQVRFELFGSIPKPLVLDRFGERVSLLPLEKSYDDFLRKFAARGWAVGICPLAETAFNHTKANNKWVEYTAVGAAVVATAGMLYDECCADGCGLLAADDGQWEAALQSLIDDRAGRLALVAAAQDRLAAEYSPAMLLTQLQDLFREAKGRVAERPAPSAPGRPTYQTNL